MLESRRQRRSRINIEQSLIGINTRSADLKYLRENRNEAKQNLMEFLERHKPFVIATAGQRNLFWIMNAVKLFIYILDFIVSSAVCEYFARIANFSDRETQLSRFIVPAMVLGIEMALDAVRQRNHSEELGGKGGHGLTSALFLCVAIFLSIGMPALFVGTQMASWKSDPTPLPLLIFLLLVIPLTVLTATGHILMLFSDMASFEAHSYIFFLIIRGKLRRRYARYEGSVQNMERWLVSHFHSYVNQIDQHNKLFDDDLKHGPFTEFARKIINDLFGSEIIPSPCKKKVMTTVMMMMMMMVVVVVLLRMMLQVQLNITTMLEWKVNLKRKLQPMMIPYSPQLGRNGIHLKEGDEMSEIIVTSIIKAGVSAVRFMFTLGKKVREMNNMACQRASIQKFQQAGLDVSSTAKLTGLNQALKTESLSPLLNRTMPNISQSTIDTISSLERFSIGNTPNIKISKEDISNALSDLTNGVQIANEVFMIEEQKKVVDDLNIVLHNCGYEIQNQTLPSKEIWVKASKGDKVLAAKVHPSSEMALDLAGFNPGECTEERKAIMADMEKLGYQFSIKKQIAHNRRDGGEIIQHINKEFARLDDRLQRLNLAKANQSRRMRA